MGIRKAQNRATRVLHDLGVPPEPPVDVEEIAEMLHLPVVHKHGLHHPKHGRVSGLLLRKGGMAVCVVNADQHPNRTRFSIAHELGHFLLHPPEETYVDPRFTANFRGDRASEGSDPCEIEANAFAAELLMPAEWVRGSVRPPLDVFEDERVRELARQFGVSQQAMTYRLMNLGLLPG
jgi:IrrE N-terminal-like domain